MGIAQGTTVTQGFRTGSHAGGYSLAGLSVVIQSNNLSSSETAILKIYDSKEDGTAGNELYKLTTPAADRKATQYSLPRQREQNWNRRPPTLWPSKAPGTCAKTCG